MKFRITFLVVSLFFLAASCYSQENYRAVCGSQQIWLVNKTQAVSLGKCEDKNWTANLKFVSQPEYAKHKQSSREKLIVGLLTQTNKTADNLTLLSQTNLEPIIDKQKKKNNILIISDTLFAPVQNLFQKIMEFVIVIGSGSYDGNGKLSEERVRYKVKVTGTNPTIGEILEAAKPIIPEDEYMNNIKKFLFLRILKTDEKLDNNKTIKDYGLEDGAAFRLQSSIR